jgi:hypothetical protein
VLPVDGARFVAMQMTSIARKRDEVRRHAPMLR